MTEPKDAHTGNSIRTLHAYFLNVLKRMIAVFLSVFNYNTLLKNNATECIVEKLEKMSYERKWLMQWSLNCFVMSQIYVAYENTNYMLQQGTHYLYEYVCYSSWMVLSIKPYYSFSLYSFTADCLLVVSL